MFYAILAIVVTVALILIFRDDHDDSYNKSEKDPRRPEKPKPLPPPQISRPESPSMPKAEQPKPSGPSDILREIEDAVRNASKSLEKPVEPAADDAVSLPDEEVDLSFLDRLEYDEALEENTETFDIAGLRYHCTEEDCGTIVGYVQPEPSNQHDPRAQAVFRSDGKLLGYIPRTQLDWYEDFNEDNIVCPFVGEMGKDGRGWLVAEIKVILPVSRSYVEEEIEFEL